MYANYQPTLNIFVRERVNNIFKQCAIYLKLIHFEHVLLNRHIAQSDNSIALPDIPLSFKGFPKKDRSIHQSMLASYRKEGR